MGDGFDTAATSQHPPCVLVVHGIGHDHHQFDPLAAYLRTQGIESFGIDLHPPDASTSLSFLAEQVATLLAEAAETRGRVHLLGFSMGGLVSRIAYEQLGAYAHTKSLITIAAPHRGTVMAYFRDLPGCVEMRPGSPLLRSLKGGLVSVAPVDASTKFLQIWTPIDHLIVPPTSGRLPVGRNVMLPVFGHNRLIDSQICHETVAAAILDWERSSES
jgi:triacylglycerol lipase